ncbi:MAG: thioredoxin [Clostridiales Family XIII bacterium]|jgi:thioredoxin 1|nr:thioredoxin [Clostridiales Family XIII bacterium]
MSEIVVLTEETFDQEIASGAVVIDFYADWCGPCKMMAPIFDEAALTYANRIKFAKLNIDECRRIAIANGVVSIPTLLFYKDGAQVDRISGVLTGQLLNEKLEALLQ